MGSLEPKNGIKKRGQYSSRDLSDRRPTYVMDTPCLTRNYVIRYGEYFDINRTPSNQGGRKRAELLIRLVNSYIEHLNDEKNTAPFVDNLEIESFNPKLKLPHEEDDREDADDIGKRRLQTVFGTRLFAGVPVEVFIDLHSEYFTVQFRAYPNSAIYDHASVIQRKEVRAYADAASKLLKALTLQTEAQKPWDALVTPNHWTPDQGLSAHPFFGNLCGDHMGDYDFLRDWAVPFNYNDLSEDMVTEAATRLLYDEFWHALFACPRRKLAITGLSPKRYFCPDPAGVGSFRDANEYAKLFNAPKEATESESKLLKPDFDVVSIFKGFVCRPAEAHDAYRVCQAATKAANETDPACLECAFRKQIDDFKFTSKNGLYPEGFAETRIDKPLTSAELMEDSNGDAGADDSEKDHAYNALVAGVKHTNLFSPFLSRVLGYRGDRSKYKDHMAGNTVLCGVLGGYGIYGSSFGRNTTAENNTPEVRYFIFYRGPSRNQLARLNRRLNSAGEARVMSVEDGRFVRQSGDDLRRLDDSLDNLISDKQFNVVSLSLLRTRMRDIEWYVRGGLRHRIGRTRYYKQRLEQRIIDLRIRRLPGWQTYDEYFARIYAPIYDTHNRIGDRILEVDQKLIQADEIEETRAASTLGLVGLSFALLAAIGLIMESIETWGEWDVAERPLNWFFSRKWWPDSLKLPVEFWEISIGLLAGSVALIVFLGFFIRFVFRRLRHRKQESEYEKNREKYLRESQYTDLMKTRHWTYNNSAARLFRRLRSGRDKQGRSRWP